MGSLLITNAIPLPLASYAAASIGASYTVAASFTSPVIKLTVTSTLDQDVVLSFDGINNHLYIGSGSITPFVLDIDFKSDRSILPTPSVSVKKVGAVTTGTLYISAFSCANP